MAALVVAQVMQRVVVLAAPVTSRLPHRLKVTMEEPLAHQLRTTVVAAVVALVQSAEMAPPLRAEPVAPEPQAQSRGALLPVQGVVVVVFTPLEPPEQVAQVVAVLLAHQE
jgi:hypothetical protein